MPGSAALERPARHGDDVLRRFAGYHMRRAYLAVQADLTETLAPFELRIVTFSALAVIHDRPGLRQSKLADYLAIERPNLVSIIDELQNRGLVRRDRAEDDRRAYALKTTEAGEALCRQALDAVARHDARAFGHIEKSRREDFLAILEELQTGEGK